MLHSLKIAASEYASRVSTDGRVLNDMFIGEQKFNCVTDVVYAAFLAGCKAAEQNLTIQQLIDANLSRVERWHSLHDWSPLEWAGAMCGEAGEAANYAKKLKRVDSAIANNDKRLAQQDSIDKRAHYAHGVGMEVADVIIYGVLLCASVDADLIACIKEAFNKKSEEYGFPERI